LDFGVGKYICTGANRSMARAWSSQGDDDLKDTGFHLTTTNQGASAAGPGFSLKF